MDRVDVETLRRIAHLYGFAFTAADLEPIRPAIERALESLARLEALPFGEVEPSTRFSVI